MTSDRPAEPLTVLAFNCTLKNSRSGKTSSTGILLDQVLAALADNGGTSKVIRAADYDIKPGVTSDEGDGDEWPALRREIIACDILVIGSPIWLGQPSSIAKRVLERMDAFLGEKDAHGRMPSYGKVAIVAAVGNEDGAHHVSAELIQALTEVGFTIPAGGATYWVGEAMGQTDYKDLKSVPEAVAKWTPLLASNAAHLARLLKARGYPGSAS